MLYERASRGLRRLSAAWARAANGGADDARLCGVVERPLFMLLAPTLRRRVLWRLLVEGTGRAPT